MAGITTTTIYKNLLGTSLPVYKSGSLKGFQLNGNYYNFVIDLIQSSDTELLSFFTPFQALVVGSYVSSCRLYSIDVDKLRKATTYADIVAARGSYYTIDTDNILKETKEDTYERFYASVTQLDTTLAAGVYELVITDSTGRIFESELFSNCLFKDSTATNLSCTVTCPDVGSGQHPVLTITITELEGSTVDDLSMKVDWNMDNSVKFNDIVFPFRFGNTAQDYSETQEFSLLPNEVKVLTFTYPYVASTGTYTVDYKINKGTCSGSEEFEIGNPCITFVSGEWSS